ncbi:hypothetical protein F4824DRAFT_449734 [Ustulina deusta]|nr:hypothetical protein F4823DRAFT_572743 [Ustulina deusta]KAI3341701.1 hypothetical protein F4824DRAFT_449734 [Ustulina deusta]
MSERDTKLGVPRLWALIISGALSGLARCLVESRARTSGYSDRRTRCKMHAGKHRLCNFLPARPANFGFHAT